MKVFFLLVTLFACNLAFSQHIQFNWQGCFYQSGYQLDSYEPSIVSAGDGYMILSCVETGNIIQPGDIIETDIRLVKIDTMGSLLWEKKFGGSDIEDAANICSADSGNYYIFGSTGSADGGATLPPYLPDGGLWLIKIDEFGNKIWDRVVGNPITIYGYGADCISTKDLGVITRVNTIGNGGDITVSYGGWDTWLLKINSIGSINWDFTLGTDGADFGGSPIQTSDNGYLIPLMCNPGSNGNILCDPNLQSTSIGRAVIVKLDSARNIEWQQCMGASFHIGFSSVLEVNDGYIIGGFASASDGAVEGAGYHLGYNNQGEQTADLWLRKIDFNGNLIWQKCYGGSGNDFPLQLFKTSDGNLVVFGETESRNGDVTGMHADPPYLFPLSEDVWMLKVNGTNGNMLWNRCIGSTEREFINNGVIQKDDRNYVLAINTVFGNRGDITCGVNEYKYFSWVSSITDTTAYVGIYDLVDISHTIKLYPNPADDYLVLEISPQFDFQNYQAEIINSEGKTVKILSLLGRNPYISIGNLPSGLYLLRLENQRMKASKRFLKI